MADAVPRYSSGEVRTYRERKDMRTQPPGARWHVTPTGKVFHSTDGGPWRRSKHLARHIAIFALVFLEEVSS
jgi:hypothetical protein